MRTRAAAIALLLLALTSTFAAAQTPTTEPGEQLRERVQEFRDRLELTAEQEEQVRPIVQDELQRLRALREKYENGSQNRRTRLRMSRELKDIQSDADARLKKVLTKTQMDELKKMREERREELKSRIGR